MRNSIYETDQAIFTFHIKNPFIVLILLEHGKGTITCKTCNETYRPDQLREIKIGRGRSPFQIDKQKGGILKNLFRKRKQFKDRGTFGGRGYECPKGHELISIITWIT